MVGDISEIVGLFYGFGLLCINKWTGKVPKISEKKARKNPREKQRMAERRRGLTGR